MNVQNVYVRDKNKLISHLARRFRSSAADDVVDALHEAFYRACLRFPFLHLSDEQLRAWLLQTAVNELHRSRIRTRRHVALYLRHDDLSAESNGSRGVVREPPAWDAHRGVDARHDFGIVLLGMTPLSREIFLRLRDGYRPSEIALRLGLTLPAVYKRIQRERTRLRTLRR